MELAEKSCALSKVWTTEGEADAAKESMFDLAVMIAAVQRFGSVGLSSAAYSVGPTNVAARGHWNVSQLGGFSCLIELDLRYGIGRKRSYRRQLVRDESFN